MPGRVCYGRGEIELGRGSASWGEARTGERPGVGGEESELRRESQSGGERVRAEEREARAEERESELRRESQS